MSTSFGKPKANDTENWQNNKEMNPAANSSFTENQVVKDDQDKADSWRNANYGNEDSGVSAGSVSVRESETGKGDPGGTPGKAEGVEDPERRGSV